MPEVPPSKSSCALHGLHRRHSSSRCKPYHTPSLSLTLLDVGRRETIAIEEPDAFFPLLDSLTNPETRPDPAPSSAEAAHKYVFDSALSAGYLAGPGAYGAAESNLALHAATPKIEAFYEYYTDRHAARRDEIGRAHV